MKEIKPSEIQNYPCVYLVDAETEESVRAYVAVHYLTRKVGLYSSKNKKPLVPDLNIKMNWSGIKIYANE